MAAQARELDPWKGRIPWEHPADGGYCSPIRPARDSPQEVPGSRSSGSSFGERGCSSKRSLWSKGKRVRPRQECPATSGEENAPKGQTPQALSACKKADEGREGASRREGNQTLRTEGGGQVTPA